MEQDNKLAKLLDGALSEAEKREMESDPDYALYERIKRYTADLAVAGRENDDDALLTQILRSPKTNEDNVRSLGRYTWWRAAAAVLVCILAGLGYIWSGDNSFAAGASANVQLQLPDASAVDLRQGSTLRYNSVSWTWQRVVDLTGEAYFDVKKGSVFTVQTSLGTVRVLGTRFDVRNRDGHFEVNCYHGKVEVAHEGKKMLIHAGESLQVENKHWSRAALFLNEPTWKRGQLIFQSATLQAVLQELASSYDLQLNNKVVAVDKQFSGALPVDDQKTAIGIIEKAFAISISKVADNRYEVSAQ